MRYLETLWFNTNNGALYIYYEDVNSIQWVTVSSGPEGPKGDKGDKGDTGNQGLTGNSATAQAGSTLTDSSPGTPANVYNAGTASAAVFNFEIPKGEPGVDGAPGRAQPGTVPPSSPSNGDLWFNSVTGVTYVYYTDYNGSRWVSINSYSPAVAG